MPGDLPGLDLPAFPPAGFNAKLSFIAGDDLIDDNIERGQKRQNSNSRNDVCPLAAGIFFRLGRVVPRVVHHGLAWRWAPWPSAGLKLLAFAAAGFDAKLGFIGCCHSLDQVIAHAKQKNERNCRNEVDCRPPLVSFPLNAGLPFGIGAKQHGGFPDQPGYPGDQQASRDSTIAGLAEA